MTHQHALGAHLYVVSKSATAPGARAVGDLRRGLVLISHGLFVTDGGAGGLTTGTTALPIGGLSVRFAVAHGIQADHDDLTFCLKEVGKGRGFDLMWPDVPVGANITNYAVGKGSPAVNGANVDAWFRGDAVHADKDAGVPEWAGRQYLDRLMSKLPANVPVDLARVRKSCHSLADVFLAMTAAHRYTHLLCHFCREEIRVAT